MLFLSHFQQDKYVTNCKLLLKLKLIKINHTMVQKMKWLSVSSDVIGIFITAINNENIRDDI